MKKKIQKLIHPFYKRYHFWYHRKPRKYNYGQVYTIVQPGVFSPKNTVSTKVFLDFISDLDLEHKKVLELGCGSGIISVLAASRKAKVWASDINKIAVKSLNEVQKEQALNINVVHSDLFDAVPEVAFDYIFINPPYYPRKPNSIEEQAWFCGAEFEFFKRLFHQISNRLESKTKVLMILSDACDLNMIKNLAQENDLNWNEVFTKPLTFEVNSIYQLQKLK